jgi:hypothetical protein
MPQAYIRAILVVEAGLILGNELRVERCLRIPRNLEFHPAGIGRHRFAA